MKNIDEVSLSTGVFGKENSPDDLLRFVDMALESGYKYIELSRRQYDIGSRAEAILRSGVKVWSVHGYLDGRGISDDESVRRMVIDEEIVRIRESAVFGKVPYVLHYLDRMNDPLYGKRYRETIEELYAETHKAGLIMAVETCPHKPKQCERYADSKEIADFVRSFQLDDLRMTIDINHSNLNEDLIDVCANCDGLIANVHMSNNHGEWEDHLPPDDGVIDFPATFAALRKHGYMGPANLEIHSSEPATAEWLENIRKYTEKILFNR